jgi:hypothetical protein
MTSYLNQGVSIIVVQYNFSTDINQASQTLTQHLNQAQARLPSGITPQVQTFSVNSLPVIQLAVTSSEDPVAQAAQVVNDVKDPSKMESLPPFPDRNAPLSHSLRREQREGGHARDEREELGSHLLLWSQLDTIAQRF